MNLFLNVSFVHFFLPFRLYALLRNANSRRRWITGHTAHWRKALGNSTHLSASLHCVLCICTTSHSVYMKCDRNTQKLEKCHTQLLLMHIISIQGISISKINIDPKIWRLDYQLVLNCHNTAQFSPHTVRRFLSSLHQCLFSLFVLTQLHNNIPSVNLASYRLYKDKKMGAQNGNVCIGVSLRKQRGFQL